MQEVPNAKLVKGIWFPEHDEHLAGQVMEHSKVGEVRLGDGRMVGTYQKHKLNWAMKHLGSDRRRLAVDVGGHIGLWSMHLADGFRQVVAFEPLRDHWRLFEINLAGNKRVTLHPFGLGGMEGEKTVCCDPSNTGNTHIIGSDEGDLDAVAAVERTRLNVHADEARKVYTETISIRTLDSFHLENVDFIKIDVEGTELQVLHGARQTIKRCRPMMVVEQKGNDAKFQGSARDVAGQYLVAMGMKLLNNYSGDWIMDWPK